MTLQQCKDKIAKRYDFDTWEECLTEAHINHEFTSHYKTDPYKLHDDAAELYARSKWDEACIAQKNLIDPVKFFEFDWIQQGEEYYESVQKPEFKP